MTSNDLSGAIAAALELAKIPSELLNGQLVAAIAI
jgi:hypothetical protein